MHIKTSGLVLILLLSSCNKELIPLDEKLADNYRSALKCLDVKTARLWGIKFNEEGYDKSIARLYTLYPKGLALDKVQKMLREAFSGKVILLEKAPDGSEFIAAVIDCDIDGKRYICTVLFVADGAGNLKEISYGDTAVGPSPR